MAHSEDLVGMLAQDEERFQAIFEGAAIGISLTDPAGNLIEVNPALCAMLGYTADELRGRSFSEVTHPADRQLNEDLYGELLAGKRGHFQIEKRYLRKDGQIVWGRIGVSPLVHADGRLQHTIGTVENITDQKVAEAA